MTVDVSDPAAVGIGTDGPGSHWYGLESDDPAPGARSTIKGYVIEARDAGEVLLATLDTSFSGEWIEKWNQPHELKFSYPAQAAAVASILAADRIWLLDLEGTVLNKFQIDSYTEVQQDARTFIEFQCYDGLLGIADGIVGAQETLNARGLPARNLLSESLSELMAEAGLHWGGVSDVLINTVQQIRVDRPQPIQRVLAKVAKHSHFTEINYMYQPASDSIVLEVAPDAPAEQVIMYGGNMTGIRRTVQRRGRVNRIYMYGEGQDPASRLNLTDAGEPNEYVEGEAPITRSLTIWDPSISLPAELLAAANARLLAENVDKVSFTVDVANVFVSNPEFADLNLLSLEVGRTTMMKHRLLDIEDEVMVTQITHSLSNLLDIRVELEAAPQTLPDVFESLMSEAEQAAKGPMRVGNDDGSRYPFIARTFIAQDLEALDALPDQHPGLSFRDGDLAYLISLGFVEGEFWAWNPLRLRDGGTWRMVPVGQGIYSAANMAALDALVISKRIYEPALGHTVDNAHYWKLLGGTWVEFTAT